MESVAEILAAEQKYFDHVSDHRERMRRALLDAPAAAANAGAAVRLRKDAEARLQRIGEPDDAVAVGRMDDEDGDVLYVGYHTIFDDDSEVLVVNWQAPAAARYFTATHTDAQGLARKRSFETTGNVVDAYEDTVFRQLAAAVAELEEPGDALLDDLNRDRTGQMQDIVRTIQAAQFDLIRAPLDEMLIIQGGPGTGKTAVALHRVSWLLFNYRDALQPEDVLIVGPTPTFTRYTRTVLPSLGDTSVAQRDIGQFHPPVRRGRVEDAEVARLKGDGRMAGLLRRALYGRVGISPDQLPIEAHLDGRPVLFTADEINQFLARSRQTPGTFSRQRQIFRSLMLNSATERARERRLGVRTALDQLIERIWPSFTAAAFLRDLFGSRDRLIAAAGDELTGRDIALLHRRSGDRVSDEMWSEADLPLLDYAEALIHGVEERYGHIIVDEAQDLSPMQLRSIAMRSSSGSMTVVGDIAQSTGLWARDDWDDVLEHLPAQLPQRLAELKYGYRVPRQVFDIAARLLPYAAPDVTAPQVVRDGPADPVFRLTDDDSRASIAVETAMAHASHGRSVAIICPAVHRWAIESELTARDVAWRAASRNELGQGVNLVSPQEAKGLEFDATVVVEPRDIIAEDERGHRLLYVALTRTTRYLAVIGILPRVGEPQLELEPFDRFEQTRTLTLPAAAIGTASVPAPRAVAVAVEQSPQAVPAEQPPPVVVLDQTPPIVVIDQAPLAVAVDQAPPVATAPATVPPPDPTSVSSFTPAAPPSTDEMSTSAPVPVPAPSPDEMSVSPFIPATMPSPESMSSFVPAPVPSPDEMSVSWFPPATVLSPDETSVPSFAPAAVPSPDETSGSSLVPSPDTTVVSLPEAGELTASTTTVPPTAAPVAEPASGVAVTAPEPGMPVTAPASDVGVTGPASGVPLAAPVSAVPLTTPVSVVPAPAPLSAVPTPAVPTPAVPTPAVPTSGLLATAVPAPVAVPSSVAPAPDPVAPAAVAPVSAAPAPVAPVPAPPASAVPVAVPSPAASSSAAPVAAARARGGTLSAQIIELAATELAGQIRDNLQPTQWQAVLQRVGELLNEE